MLQKIQAIYFEICALCFKISALYFCRFQTLEKQWLLKEHFQGFLWICKTMGGRDRGVVWKIMPVVDDGC
ncbi:MAG: hypothetical protein SO210_02650 [Bacteroidaceae bacterium]|nr:hypothetical protein [Bacteroidaceae bacterium]